MNKKPTTRYSPVSVRVKLDLGLIAGSIIVAAAVVLTRQDSKQQRTSDSIGTGALIGATDTNIQNSIKPIDLAAVTMPDSRSVGGGGEGKAARGMDAHSNYTNALESVIRLMDAQDYEAALASLESLNTQKLNSDHQNQVAILRARLLIALKRFDEAPRICSALVNSADDPAVLREAASRLFILSRESGNLQGLLSEQTERLQNEPANTNALYVAALLYQYAGDVRSELRAREAFSGQADDVENTSRLVQLYSQTGAKENAAVALGRLAELRPDCQGYLLAQKAELEFAAGSLDAAAATARDGLALPTVVDSTAFKLARVLAEAGKTQEAAEAYERLASHTPVQEAKDRFLLEACRNRLVLNAADGAAIQALQKLTQSSTDYVRKEAAKLLTNKN